MDFNVYVCCMENTVKVTNIPIEWLSKVNDTEDYGILEYTISQKNGKYCIFEVVFKDIYSLKEFLNNN